VKSTATRSTATLFPEEGAKCVMEVFEEAYRDVGPEQLHPGLAMGGGGGGGGRGAGGGGGGGVGGREGGKAPIGRIPTAASMRALMDSVQHGPSPSSSSASSASAGAAAAAGVSGLGLAEVLASAFGMR
jgi:hypothetical protein